MSYKSYKMMYYVFAKTKDLLIEYLLKNYIRKLN